MILPIQLHRPPHHPPVPNCAALPWALLHSALAAETTKDHRRHQVRVAPPHPYLMAAMIFRVAPNCCRPQCSNSSPRSNRSPTRWEAGRPLRGIWQNPPFWVKPRTALCTGFPSAAQGNGAQRYAQLLKAAGLQNSARGGSKLPSYSFSNCHNPSTCPPRCTGSFVGNDETRRREGGIGG